MEGTSLQRLRRGKKQWQEILARHSEAGMSVREFCKVEGISEASFHKWHRRLFGPTKAAFVEIPREVGQGRGIRAELDLGQGMVFRIFG